MYSESMNETDISIVENRIISIRGQRVILDSDLAQIYGVETKRLNEAVKRNADRFPDDFSFVLTREDVTNLKSQIATSSYGHGGRRKAVSAFTEHGAIMVANILRSKKASVMSIFVVRAFVKMREQLLSQAELEGRLTQIENALLSHDQNIRELYQQLRPLLLPPPDPPAKSIGFSVRERGAKYSTKIEQPILNPENIAKPKENHGR